MKTYKVTVNGTAYEITLEAVDAASINTATAKEEPKAAPAAPTAPAATAASAAPAGATTISCPMPGTILSVNVSNGSSVKKGDVLMILEAMKMENEIMAPCDGVVSNVISKGSSVETGAVLCTLA